MPPAERIAVAALVAVLVALILVGLASGTILRHAVQVAPLLVASLVVIRRAGWSPYAAVPLFLFWLFIMALVWLYLLGVAKVVTGRFSATEVALTVVIGFACVVGLGAAARIASHTAWWARLAVFVAFGAFQVGAMWMSLQPVFASR